MLSLLTCQYGWWRNMQELPFPGSSCLARHQPTRQSHAYRVFGYPPAPDDSAPLHREIVRTMEFRVFSTLNGISQQFRSYDIDGIPTIGVFGDEPYELRFTNSSGSKIQLRLSVDGTDVVSGNPATLNLSDGVDTFVVQPHGTVQLKAWLETTKGGGRFVFKHAENSVAMHTHGDALGAMGYLAAAVFTERYVQPQLSPYPTRGGGLLGGESYRGATRGIPKGASGPGTGVGEYVSQEIGRTRGLIQPEFSETLQVRYLWWDDLVARLRALGIQPPAQHPTGFAQPGNPIMTLANLGTTPRPEPLKPVPAVTTTTGEYQRFM